MAKKYLDENGLLYFWQKIKALFVTDVTYDSASKKIQKTKNGSTSDVVTLSTVATSGSYNDLSNKPTIPSAVQPTTTTPKMDGTAAVGSETKYAKGDHVHPSDTSRVPITRTINNKALSADITLEASDVGAVPTTRKVNGHALSADVTVTASDIGVEEGAEVNQNAFSNVKVGTTTVAADTKTDTLELVAGSNVTITPDATNDKITIEATDTKYTAASATPLMDGTAAVGSSAKYAREDHVHPTDTSRQADLGLTSADVTKWNDAITLTKNNVEYSISGSEIVTDPTLGVQLLELKGSGGVTLLTGIGLAMVNNIAAQTYVPNTAKGAASGVCPLDANSKVDSQYLPSYVDDVIEAYPVSGATALSAGWLSATSGGSALTPETGKIYVLMVDSGDYSANSQFRWSGSTYVKLADGGVSSITNAEIDTIVAS